MKSRPIAVEENLLVINICLKIFDWNGTFPRSYGVPDLQKKCVKHLLAKQLTDGGWSSYPGGPSRLDPSVKAYFALKLAGMGNGDAEMRQAATLIRNFGGIEKAR